MVLLSMGTFGGRSIIAMATPTTSTVSASQNYCPEGYVCIATNMSAKGYDGASGKTLTGISVYKRGNNLVAYVPNHGNLKLFWSSGGQNGWHFYADNGVYVILNLDKDI